MQTYKGFHRAGNKTLSENQRKSSHRGKPKGMTKIYTEKRYTEMSRRLLDGATMQDVIDEFGVARETINRAVDFYRREILPQEFKPELIDERIGELMKHKAILEAQLKDLLEIVSSMKERGLAVDDVVIERTGDGIDPAKATEPRFKVTKRTMYMYAAFAILVRESRYCIVDINRMTDDIFAWQGKTKETVDINIHHTVEGEVLHSHRDVKEMSDMELRNELNAHLRVINGGSAKPIKGIVDVTDKKRI